MKILYGVQGTGNGHIARSRIMAKYLKEHNAEVTYLFSGRDKDQFFDMQIFGDFLYRRGLTFSVKNGQLNYLSTLKANHFCRFIADVYQLDLAPYELIISDFEPVTAWAAKFANKKVLGIGHQYAFSTNTPITGESFIAKKILNNFAPAKQSIGLHWAKYDEHVLPPIIDVSLRKSPISKAILVYLPFENQLVVTKLLNQYPDYQFIQYAPTLSDGHYANVTLRKVNHHGFKDDLRQASGVICNSGFELNSECLYLGIPILTKPLKGQMEQESNALALQQLGLAVVMNELDQGAIGKWLATKVAHKSTPFPDVAKNIVDWLLNQQGKPLASLSKQLWDKQCCRLC